MTNVNLYSTYMPLDRRHALLTRQELPDRAHGAALFADVSGFTPLTGVLAEELGRQRGAEEVLNFINPVYEAIIAEVHRFGGSVIGFAGDAITCWYDDQLANTHTPGVLRAVACAVAMQTAMQQFATVYTPGGTAVSLELKVAVAAGAVRRFVVGDPNVQLIDVLAGETLQRMAGAEDAAEKGEITLSKEVVAALADAITIATWRENSAGKSIAVLESVNVIVPPTPWPTIAEDRLPHEQVKSWILPAVYQRLLAGRSFLGELRPAVALFMRFSGLDYDGDEAAPRKMDAFIRWAQNIITRYEGFLIQLTIGDKGSFLYAGFGAPIAHDDDPVRAVAAALDLRANATAFEGIDEVQIGLSMGHMWSGAVGSESRSTYGIMGENTNMAARLMAKAKPNQILVRKRVERAAEMFYHFTDLGEIQVKGQEAPLPVAEVIGRKQSASNEWASFDTELIGRQAILQQLNVELDAAATGNGRILQLIGGVGIGKSHLAAQFSQQAKNKGFQLSVGACQSITRSDVYFSWRQIITELLALPLDNPQEAIEQLTEWFKTYRPQWLLRLPLLGGLLNLPLPDNATTAALDAATRQKALFTLVVELVQTLAQTQPLLLVFENAQWLDEASADLCFNVAQAIVSVPVLMLFVQRPLPDEDDSALRNLAQLPGCSEIKLPPLSSTESALLVETYLGAPVSSLLLEVVRRVSLDNPFFITELLEVMQQAGQIKVGDNDHWQLAEELLNQLQLADSLTKEADQWHLKPDINLATISLGIPDSIHGIILSRLDQLPESHKLTLKVGSVVGQYFELLLVSKAHPEKPGLPILLMQAQEMKNLELVRNGFDDNVLYAFQHHTTQKVAYETLLFAQRRTLHSSVARVLAAQDTAAVYPIAHHAYLGEDWALSLHYQLLAADHAKHLFANRQAIEFYQKAYRSLQALTDEQTGAEALTIHLNLGELLVATAQYAAAAEHLDMAQTLAQQAGDWVAEARACRWYGRFYELRSEYPAALAWLDRGLLALKGNRSQEEAEIALISGLINVRQGNYDRCLELCARSMGVADEMDDTAVRARTYNLMGIVSWLRGDSQTAVDRYRQSLLQYENIGDIYGQANTHNLLANGLYMQGKWRQADEHYRRSLTMFTQIGDRYNQVLVDNNLGGIAVKQGRHADAVDYYEKSLRLLQESGGSTWLQGALRMNLANARLQAGALGQATIELQGAQTNFTEAQVRQFLPELHGLWAEVIWRQGDLATAVTHAQQAIDLARELQMPREESHNLRIMAEIINDQGQSETAVAILQQALDTAVEAGDEYEIAKIRVSLAQIYVMENRYDEAKSLLQLAIETFQRLEAALDLQKAEQLIK